VLEQAERLMPTLDLLRERGVLGGDELIARYLPSHLRQRQRQAMMPNRAVLTRHLAAATKGLPFAPALFEPFQEAVELAKTQALVDLETFRGTVFGTKLQSLLFQREGKWFAVVPLRGIEDRTALRQIIDGQGQPSTTYLDLKEESSDLMAIGVDGRASIVLGAVARIGPHRGFLDRSGGLIEWIGATSVAVSRGDFSIGDRPRSGLRLVF
jgi:predicted exporter